MPVFLSAAWNLNAVNRKVTSQLVCCLLAGLCTQTFAKEYSVATILRAGAEYDDNVRLEKDETSIAGMVVSPELNLGLRTERLDVALNTALDFARFNESEYNSDDQNVSLATSYAFEYDVFNAAAQLKRDSTRTSETPEGNEVFDTGTGEVGLKATRREAQSLSLGWQHLFTDKQSVELSANYASVDYQAKRLNDYDYAGINAAYAIKLSDRTRFITQFGTSWFESNTYGGVQFGRRETGEVCIFDPISNASFLVGETTVPVDENCPLVVQADIEQDTYRLDVGVERVLTEKLFFSIFVGASYVETSFDSRQADGFSQRNEVDVLAGLADQDDTAFFFSSTLRYEAERTTLNLDLSSKTDPSSNGYLVLSNQLFFNVNHRLSERSDVFTKLGLIDSSALGDAVDATGRSSDLNDRTYGVLSVGASYRLTEAWYVEASYRYRAQDREYLDDVASSNAALLRIAYKPHKKTWSR